MHSLKREFILVCIACLAACGESAPPEERVRAFIAETETLVESRQFTELVDCIAGDYLDERGNDKLKAVAMLRGFYLRYRSVHLLTRIDTIRLPSPEHAVVTVYVAMAQRPFGEDKIMLPDTDIFRVELELVADGDSYEILQTRWQRASAADIVF